MEPLQNVPEGLKEVTIETGAGTSCYRRLKAGERYVIITSTPGFSVAGCNPSFQLAGNEHILDAMRSRLQGGAPRLLGSVLKTTGRYSHEGGISNAAVELKRGEIVLAATTDSEGRYVLPGLEPGRYQIRVRKDGYIPDDEYNRRWSGRMFRSPGTNRFEPVKEVPGEVEIFANSCEIRDLAMWPAGHIRGVVRGVDGTPLKGVPVQAFGFDAKGRRESTPLQTVLTDSEGQYDLQPLPSGRYAIGVNARLYDDENPYPPTLYAEGQPVYLGESGAVAGADFAVPAPRVPARLRVRVLSFDGTPHKGATVRLETPAGIQRWFSRDETDDRGELVAPVYVGQRYNVQVFHYVSEGRTMSKREGFASVDVTDHQPAVTVVLQAER